MHKPLRVGVLIPFGLLIICIISGCSDDAPTGDGEINLLTTVPEDGGIVSATGELRMVFDSFPKSVYVDGKPAIIQDNTAIVKITDLSNLIPGTEKTVTVEWRNQENFLAGSKTITFTVLKRVTVMVDPAPSTTKPNVHILTHTEFTLRFDEEIAAVTINGTPATGSGLNWKWRADPHLPYGSVFLNIEWTNRDGSTGVKTVGPYEAVDNGGEPPIITSGTVADGDAEVDPTPINAGGFRFDFDEDIIGTIKLTDEAGVDLNWIANVAGQTATLTAVAGQELVNETTYKIEIDVRDGADNPLQTTITFVTKPK